MTIRLTFDDCCVVLGMCGALKGSDAVMLFIETPKGLSRIHSTRRYTHMHAYTHTHATHTYTHTHTHAHTHTLTHTHRHTHAYKHTHT